MSVLSTLALLVTSAAVKVRPSPEGDVSDKAHPRFIAGYDAGLKDGRLEHDELRRERDDWRARAEAWRERAIDRIDARPPLPAGPDFRPPELARTQELQWYAAQQQYHQANQANQQQNAQMAQQNLYQQGLLGAQGLNPELFCNCVPSRAQVWAARPGDGA